MRELFLNLGLAFVPVSITLTALWLSARSRALRAEETIRQIAMRERPMPMSTSHHGDIEPTLDAIVLGVDQIAEGQRFIAKLLSERHVAPAPKLPGWITPH